MSIGRSGGCQVFCQELRSHWRLAPPSPANARRRSTVMRRQLQKGNVLGGGLSDGQCPYRRKYVCVNKTRRWTQTAASQTVPSKSSSWSGSLLVARVRETEILAVKAIRANLKMRFTRSAATTPCHTDQPKDIVANPALSDLGST